MLRQGNWGLKCAASQDRALKLYPVWGQWDNYPIDFNISKNHISLIMHFQEKRHRRRIVL